MPKRWLRSNAMALVSWFALFGSLCVAGALEGSSTDIPLIVAGDLGYLERACYDGELDTPNIDAPAAPGLRPIGFCVALDCSPTRSVRLRGTDNFIAGFGNAPKKP